MKPAPTLLDELYRATFNYSAKRRGIGFVDQPEHLRRHLSDARKFVLDDKMSAFLADLSSAAFMDKKRSKKSAELVYRLVDQLRISARLPHKLTWIEFNFAVASRRARDLGLTSPFDVPGEQPRTGRQGWLLNQHSTDETLFRVHVFENMPPLGLMMAPFAYGWRTDEEASGWQLPPRNSEYVSLSEACVGVVGYRNDRCSIVEPEYFHNPEHPSKPQVEVFNEFFKVHASTLRRVWALLATVNDLPVLAKTVTPIKGFVARGQYRRFLEHKIITLHVPEKADQKKLARNLIASCRRRAHQVRGHWRKDHWRPGERLWIAEHQRGDASLGFVMHDYVVSREAAEAAE